MEQKEQPNDNPGIASLSGDPLATDAYKDIESASKNLLEPEEKTPALSRRLAEAFREGIASTRPDGQMRPEVRAASSLRKDRQRSDNEGALDRAIHDGRSAASVLYRKASGALDSATLLAKTAPAASRKWAEAFRDGFESVRSRDAETKKGRAPSAPGPQESGARGIMDRMLHVGESAAEAVRGVAVSVKPGGAHGAERKIRAAEKDIASLYVQIGREAVDSWKRCAGVVESEKLDELFSELRKSEEEVRSLRGYASETGTAKSGPVAKEAAFIPATDEEDISFGADAAAEKSESGDLVFAEAPGPLVPEAQCPEYPSAPEQPCDAETATLEAKHDADEVLPGDPCNKPGEDRGKREEGKAFSIKDE